MSIKHPPATDEEVAKLRQAIGLLSTLHPTMVMDPDDPITMAHAIHAHVEKESARLKAEVERLKERECPRCFGVGRVASTWEGRAVNIDCPNCGGTGRAR